ncbi:MAG: acyl-ACP--UDP-N-acetylglucosamine O-acyltransferase [Gemmataceae bacterium]
MSARIHPTAVVSKEAELADDVEIGAYAVIEGKVRVGRGTILRPASYLYGPLTMGEGNLVCTGAVLGEKPQHVKYQNEPTSLEIGDHNIFREHVTIHRGTTHSWKTVIGSHNFFMVHCHIAHDCVVGSRCVFVNGCMLGGHCQVSDQVYISANSGVHQFCRIGRLALLSGMSALTTDMPPFVIQQGHNTVSGLNLIGMRRAGMTHAQIDEAKHAFRIVFREGLTLPVALLEKEMLPP